VSDVCPDSDTFSLFRISTILLPPPAARPFDFAGLSSGSSSSSHPRHQCIRLLLSHLLPSHSWLGLDEIRWVSPFLASEMAARCVRYLLACAPHGHLAIGELVGAASFIVSCVVGSMCIIKPFRVNVGTLFEKRLLHRRRHCYPYHLVGWINNMRGADAVLLDVISYVSWCGQLWTAPGRNFGKKYNPQRVCRDRCDAIPYRDDEPYRDNRNDLTRTPLVIE